jgi:tetratricopeptide (TPR) repeat protein
MTRSRRTTPGPGTTRTMVLPDALPTSSRHLPRSMPSPLLVEQALSLVPDLEEFLPFTDALIGVSEVDREKRWAASSSFQVLGKRIVDPTRLAEQLPRIAALAQERLGRMFELVLAAVRAQQAGEPAEAVHRLVEAGELEEEARHAEKAERIYTLALGVASNLRDRRPQILVLRRLARTARGAGRLDRAEQLYMQSYQLAGEENDAPGQVVACQGLGNVSADLGRRGRARGWYELGLRLADGLASPELEWPLHSNLSSLARQEGDLVAAGTLLEKARAGIEAAAGSGSARLFWYNNVGLLLTARGDAAGSERVYREALALELEALPELTLRVNLGYALVAQGRLLEAEEEARRAEEIGILARLVPDLVDVYDLLGTVARHRGDGEGFVFYEQALAICRERELPPRQEAALYLGYGRLAAACGRADEGFAYLELSREIYARLGLEPELARADEALDVLRMGAA